MSALAAPDPAQSGGVPTFGTDPVENTGMYPIRAQTESIAPKNQLAPQQSPYKGIGVASWKAIGSTGPTQQQRSLIGDF